ncbi:phosphoglycerate mutase-like protein [Gonapodya prolifera JEL478]|uniref:Phosphoglycerate mutase-like protein n=1 Tax=Gonapodya prolifera (strain JEL478) TaxID=1344416 RepID=A0A139A623_GONPJ|nr:phosphoglycerate mutase-like protein [Gonapodya prolifera JEL478]|eukprot:KXS12270.1 phosphoglycerate mutase-like protein [Gonapodya prolifera JEL478]
MAAQMERGADLDSLYPQHLKLKSVQIVHRHGARTPAREFSLRWMPSDVFSRSCALAPTLHSRLLAQELLSVAREGKAHYDPNIGGTGMKVGNDGVGNGNASGHVSSDPAPAAESSFPFHERPIPIHSFYEERGGSRVGEHGEPFYKSSWAYRHLVHALDRIQHSPGTCDLGQLTDSGKTHLQSIGTLLRERYVAHTGFLPPKLDSTDGLLHVQSSDYARVMESTQYLLAGLYPASLRRAGLNLTIHVRPMETEFIYNPPSTCARLQTLYASFNAQFEKSARPQLSAIERAYPQYIDPDAVIIPRGKEEAERFKTRATHHDLYDANACLMGDGKGTLPGVSKEAVTDMGRVLAGVWYGAFCGSLESTRLSMGRLVNRITNRIEAAAGLKPAVPVDDHHVSVGQRESAAEKVAIWSGHDATIAPLLISLKAWDGNWPEFGSNVIFELLEDTSSVPSLASSATPTPVETRPYSARHSVLNWKPSTNPSPPSTSKSSPTITKSDPPSPPHPAPHYVRILHNLKPLTLSACIARHPTDPSLCELQSFLKDVVGAVRMGDREWEEGCKV